jgi:hypothetical protein
VDARAGYPNVLRLWRLLWLASLPHMEGVGAIIQRNADDVPPEEFLALVSFAVHGDVKEIRKTWDGRRVHVSDVIAETTPEQFAQDFAVIDDALVWLDVKKQELIDDGWREASLDPIGDPD